MSSGTTSIDQLPSTSSNPSENPVQNNLPQQSITNSNMNTENIKIENYGQQLNGFTTSPRALNSWLKDQPNGYINGGDLNWTEVLASGRNYRALHPGRDTTIVEGRRRRSILPRRRYTVQPQRGIPTHNKT